MTNRNNALQNLRDIINGYNQNIQLYNLNLMDYNRNITSILHIISQQQQNRGQTPLPRLSTPRPSLSRPSPLFRQRRRAFATNDEDNFYANILLGLSNQYRNILSRRGLTTEEIEIHTRTIQYNDTLPEPRCPITHEDFQVGEDLCQIIHCGHYFRPNMLRRWFDNNSTCPVCRHDILGNSNFIPEPAPVYSELTSHPPPPPPESTPAIENSDGDFLEEIPLSEPPPLYEDFTQESINLFDNIINENLTTDSSLNLTYTFDIPLYGNMTTNNSNIIRFSNRDSSNNLL